MQLSHSETELGEKGEPRWEKNVVRPLEIELFAKTGAILKPRIAQQNFAKLQILLRKTQIILKIWKEKHGFFRIVQQIEVLIRQSGQKLPRAISASQQRQRTN